jgi:alanyl-tRNA synthetase
VKASTAGGCRHGRLQLYDTNGLALDEQQEMARSTAWASTMRVSESEMEQQRERSRASWKGSEKASSQSLSELRALGARSSPATNTSTPEAKVIVCWWMRKPVQSIAPTRNAEFVLNVRRFTPKPSARSVQRRAIQRERHQGGNG